MNCQKYKRDKRNAILKAALELIAENGFHGAPTSKIAQMADVGVGSIYRYFRDKDELIHQVFQYVSDKMSTAIFRDYDPDAPIREQFLRVGINMFHFLVENPRMFAFTEQYFNSPYGISHKREVLVTRDKGASPDTRHPLQALLETARDREMVKDLPFPVLGALSFGPIMVLVRDVCAGLFELDADTVRRTVQACWDGIKR